MPTKTNDLIMRNEVFIWVATLTGVILLIPLMAMPFTSEVEWSIVDFFIIGTLLLGSGSIFVFAARKIQNTMHRLLLGLGILAVVLYVWAELAVGIFTNLGS